MPRYVNSHSLLYLENLHSVSDNMLTCRSQSDYGSTGLPDCGDSIDPMTFEQILEMDDDEDEREFSKSIVFGFFDQAEVTFAKMDDALSVTLPFCDLLSILVKLP